MAEPLEEVIGYRFGDAGLLKLAMSHKSFTSESGSGACNERLEFLGDSVLAAVVAHQLFSEYPDEPEGNLSKKKSLLVSRPSLAAWAEELGLGQHLYLGVGEETTGGRTRQSLLANALEALIGAIYLDGGYDAASVFIRTWCARRHGSLLETDHKSRLQEILQKKHKVPPTYEIASSAGPDHDKTFTVTVRIGEDRLGTGTGKSKKEAEQAAARDALSRM
ncbi:MAG: ribonuclease III [Elusimicrobia bacterium RBG_16_66_12]|nr:MAG: ribonuclease III [Elusimicrobia bacterium RBG_16_66_12]